MRTCIILLLSHLILLSSNAQNFRETELKTTITAATVFLEGAQITRLGQVNLQDGHSEVVLESLSPYIAEKSIQVKAEGEFTILSVNHELNHLNELDKNDEVQNLENEIKALEKNLSINEVRLEVLHEKESLLAVNKKLDKDQGGSLSQLREAIDFYDEQLSEIKTEALEVEENNMTILEKKAKLEQQIRSIEQRKDLPFGEIRVRLETQGATKGIFTITYLVANAGWYPKYDIRVSNINEPLQLRYKADVFQNTGVNWEKVKLRLSNGTPNQSGLAPALETWYLNYTFNTYQPYIYREPLGKVGQVAGKVIDEAGDPIPGVNVVVKGTTVGTTTDIEGNYMLTLPNGATSLTFSFIGLKSRELPITSSKISTQLESDTYELEEVVVSAFSEAPRIRIRGSSSIAKSTRTANAITSTVFENQTTVEFEVDKPYSLESNNERLSVNLQTHNIDASYEYFAAPKLDKDAFLIAQITDWDQYNLLEGEANLYFEGTFVGRSVLDAKSLSDTLSISLGRDKSIVIGRSKIDDFTKKKTIGSNQINSRGFKILVRNKKNQSIKLTLTDQVPVAAINAITVDVGKLSGATHQEKTGLLSWNINLEPQEQKEIVFSYSVKYPKKESINLE